MPEPMIQVEGLTKRFGAFTAVDHVTFTVGKGSICGAVAVASMLTGWLDATGDGAGSEGTVGGGAAAEVALIAGADFLRGLSHFSQRMPPPVISQPHMKHFRAMRTFERN